MTRKILAATDEALRDVTAPRFLRTERGFQGRFYCALQHALEQRGLLHDGYILEMEYQKSAPHGISQRPDIVLHIPAEESGAPVSENNCAVWALKRRASLDDARDDFKKLDEMFHELCYPIGIFINLDAKDHFAAAYTGRFSDRLQTVAVWMADNGKVVTSWGILNGLAAMRPSRQAH